MEKIDKIYFDIDGVIKGVASPQKELKLIAELKKCSTKRWKNSKNEIVGLDNRLQDINDKLSGPVKFNETKEEFLNIIKSLGFKMRNGNPAEKDNLARIMF